MGGAFFWEGGGPPPKNKKSVQVFQAGLLDWVLILTGSRHIWESYFLIGKRPELPMKFR